MLGLQPGAPLRTILCLGAHSDDIEIGCGGALLRLIAEHPDAHVWWVVLSGDAQRAREARASARDYLRGARHSVVIESYRDGFFPQQTEAIKERFEALKRELAAAGTPDLIFTHRRDDAHQDHRTVSQLTWNTFRDHLILEYEIPKWDGDLRTPNLYVRVDKAIAAKKVRLLMKHFGTQRNKHWFTPDTFNALLRLRGLECASPSGFAEGFHAYKVAV
jgi:LmbE family N-acetylglucosaminyl deacetylase